MNRRELLRNAGVAMAVSPLSAIAGTRQPVGGPVAPLPEHLITNLNLSLATTFNNAKARTLTSAHLSHLSGMLEAVFPIWEADGTFDKLQAALQTQPTPVYPSNVVRQQIADACQSIGAMVTSDDLRELQYSSPVIPDIRFLSTRITNSFQEAAVSNLLAPVGVTFASEPSFGWTTHKAAHKRTVYFGCPWPFMAIGLSAGLVAAISYFSPPVVACFGTIAALALILDYLLC